MLGDAEGNGPGGFLMLDDKFNIVGRWERDATGMNYNDDFSPGTIRKRRVRFGSP